jgi:hypothetical protein
MKKLLLLTAALVVAMAVPANAGIGWLNKCGYSHSLSDDPIIYPNQPGVSHLHDFFGAQDTNASSTIASMQAGGTTCQAGDTSGYWTPALYQNGQRVLPAGSFDGRETRQQFYYRDDNLAPGTTVEAFPPGFMMVAGNSHATSEADNPELGSEIYWGCADNNGLGGKQTQPEDCAVGIISLHVGFPNCWDGVHLNTAMNPGSLVYPSDGECPASNPVALPRLIERFEYPVGPTTGVITLSSGPTYTAHADFWNTWDQTVLEERVTDCLNADVNCGEFVG